MTRFLAAPILMILLASAALGETFVLRSGGQITGTLLNRGESPRRTYVIRVEDGATITLAASRVKKILPSRPDEIEYERIRPTYADTAAAQWELAQWCFEHKLNALRETHLRRVIELDSDHAKARSALGYTKVDGKWNTRKEAMIEKGYVYHKGKWKTPQEIEVLESKQKRNAAQQEWFQKIKRWRGWLGKDRDQEGRDNIRAINDPAAAKALAMSLGDDRDPQVRMLMADALANIDTVAAAEALAAGAIYDSIEEVRSTCLDRLQTKPRPEIISYFVARLRDKDNGVINLAGVALGRMKDPAAVGPLIDALITDHKFKIEKPGGEGSTSAGFGSGGGGISVGNKPTIIHKSLQNQSVLDALVAITGRNFNFDQQAWKYWYSSQKKAPDAIDARRDGK